MKTYLEYHPENGHSPFVVIVESGDAKLWFAYQTKQIAETKRIEFLDKFRTWN